MAKPSDRVTWCLRRAHSVGAIGPFTTIEVREEAQRWLEIESRPSIWRAIDVLRAIGYTVYEIRKPRRGMIKSVRLPKRLDHKRQATLKRQESE